MKIKTKEEYIKVQLRKKPRRRSKGVNKYGRKGKTK